MTEQQKVPAPVAAGNEDTRTAPNQGMTHRRVYHRRRYIDVDGTRVMWCGARWKRTRPAAGNAAPCPLCALAVAVAHEELAA